MSVDDARPGPVHLALAGRVTVADVRELHRQAVGLADRGRDVTVCLRQAGYVDVAAMQVIVALGRELHGRDLGCELTNVPAAVRADFHRAGLGHVLPDQA